jgi:hypothetical protein
MLYDEEKKKKARNRIKEIAANANMAAKQQQCQRDRKADT